MSQIHLRSTDQDTAQDELQRLAVVIDRTPGSALLFTVVDTPATGLRLARVLTRMLHRPVVTVRLRGDDSDALSSIRHTASGSADNAAVFVHDLALLLPGRGGQTGDVLAALNWWRDAFKRLNRPLVFWVPRYALELIARHAPDFFDWNSGVYDLSSLADASTVVAGEGTVTDGTFDSGSMTPSGRQRRLDELTAQLHAIAGTSPTAQLARAELLISIGQLELESGDYAEAQASLEQALDILQQTLGDEHPRTATALNVLGAVQSERGDFMAARMMFERALAIRERVLGPDHPDTATSLNNLASLLRSTGDYAAAQPLVEQALAIRERVLGPDHLQTASSLINLAALLQAAGDYAAARPLLERALTITERALGPDHPDTAKSLNNLAVIEVETGNLERARDLLLRAVRIVDKHLGREHPTTQRFTNNLAAVLADLGQLPAGEDAHAEPARNQINSSNRAK